MEAVTAGVAVCANAQYLCGNNVRAMQQQHPVHGPHEFNPGVAPAHAPGYRQDLQGLFHQAGDDLAGRLAALHGTVGQETALVRFQLVELCHADTAGTGETLGGSGGISVIIEGGNHVRATAHHLAIRLCQGYPLDLYGQPAG